MEVCMQNLESEKRLEPPKDFSFPFPPYDIQKQFMQALFTVLEDKKLAIFESPTGTGKSLSLLCGSLTWLEQRNQERLDHLYKLVNSFDLISEESEAQKAENWIAAQSKLRKKKEVIDKAKRELKFLEDLSEKRRKYLQKRKEYSSAKNFSLREKSLKNKGSGVEDKKNDKELDVEDLMLNDEFAPDMNSDSDEDYNETDEEPEFFPTRVIFASRTHSQLGQFANELKRTSFASKVTAVSLGSRQNLCINSDVTKLKSLTLMNERCLDLQKGTNKGNKTSDTKKMKGCSGCQYFNHSGIEELKSQILSEPMDIEDLVKVAKECNACPYYASRKASKEAQLVLLPYNTILHSGTRDGVGLKIQNSVLLLDEAHNLIESISNMYSNYITRTQVEDCSNGLKAYIGRYMSRFSASNLLKLKQVAFILKALIQFFGKFNEGDSQVMTVQQFKVSIGIDNLDLYELQKFMKKSKLIFKLKGYLHQKQKIEEKLSEEEEAKKHAQSGNNNNKIEAKSIAKMIGKNKKVPPIKSNDENTTGNKTERVKKPQSGQSVLNFFEFFKSLRTVDSEGRIILDGSTSTIKFLLLNTSDHFNDLIKSARSIVLAGGTMKPYDEIENQLFHSAKERISHFSCNHVIPDENLVCLALTKGPSSSSFDFTFKNRSSPNLMEELSRTIINISKIAPGGLVCFLPSYDYEASLQTFLKQSGAIEKIESRKKVFREPKDSNCDTILKEYSRQIKNNPGGALLFAVVGGKLSEGINFSDDLGRCVIVVGLPYPNIMNLEIKEKVKYATEKFGQDKGQQLLTNMCSKAVNQSIGRAIRHSGDYAAIVLIDQRFALPNQQNLLPNWILKRFQGCDQFGHAVKSIAKFFNDKKKAKSAIEAS